MGYSMILYPTTVLFRATEAIRRALSDLRSGNELPPRESVDMKDFEEIVDINRWAQDPEEVSWRADLG